MFGSINIGEQVKWQKKREGLKVKPDFLRTLRVLVVGGGSVGRRHLENLLCLGVTHVALVDPREDRRERLKEYSQNIKTYETEKEAYEGGEYDVVVVANPPAFHIESGNNAVTQGAHILMEKSISNKVEGVDEFLKRAKAAGLLVGVNYMYRFFDTLQYIKTILDKGELGKVYSVQMTFSEYQNWKSYGK